MIQRKKLCAALLAAALLLPAGCAAKTDTAADTSAASASDAVQTDAAQTETDPSSQVATADQMTTVVDVVEDGMVPINGDALKDGTYAVTVDSSSSMFNIVQCELTVENGQMTAVMHMGGTGYLYVYMGTGEEAVAASQDAYIPFEELSDGTHTFTVPVEALDAGVPCAAFSKNKELWYDRTLLFRADSLPLDAFGDSAYTTVDSLGLADGTYTVDVQLEGGSGKASVASPAALSVENGAATATVIWSSSNYDYMVVDGEKLLPVTLEGGSTFEIPVSAFDFKMPVSADTTAMSTPHEIEYTLYFDSASITPAS
jgi:hypothetical protein